MTFLNFNMQTSALLGSTLLFGLLAGILFTWQNAVTPGIGRLDDLNYLKAFQHMNRTILNPLFYIVFVGPLVLSLSSIYVYRSNPNNVLWLLVVATVIYVLGVLLVTIMGNIPLNEMLDKTTLEDSTFEEVQTLRSKFEAPWNNYHVIRTIASIGSFVLYILACIIDNGQS
ncbi:MAG: DUF1772 domain-containing protein [Aureispira sp.]|nr:DUF1772 domain-containing protein [Aureispira sp.]